MNDDSLHDPQLQSFEARLAASPPGVSPAERQELLYACAFAAGQHSAERSVRRWRIGAVALGVLLVGVSASRGFESASTASRTSEQTAPVQPPVPPRPAAVEPQAIARSPAAVELDAWQLREPTGKSLGQQLAHADPQLQAMSVGALTRTLMKP